MAVNALAKAGFTQVHNIIDGFEGDKVEDPESVYHGKRMRNGWKNSAPWTYRLDPAVGLAAIRSGTGNTPQDPGHLIAIRDERQVRAV